MENIHKLWDANIILSLLGEFAPLLFDRERYTSVTIRIPVLMRGPYQFFWVESEIENWKGMVEDVFPFAQSVTASVAPPRAHKDHMSRPKGLRGTSSPYAVSHKISEPAEREAYLTGYLEAKVRLPGGFKSLEYAKELSGDIVSRIKGEIAEYASQSLVPPWETAGVSSGVSFSWSMKISWSKLVGKYGDTEGIEKALHECLGCILNLYGISIGTVKFDKPKKFDPNARDYVSPLKGLGEDVHLGGYVTDEEADPHLINVRFMTENPIAYTAWNEMCETVTNVLGRFLEREGLYLSDPLKFKDWE